MEAHLRVPEPLLTALVNAGVEMAAPERGLVFAPVDPIGDDWDAVRGELGEAFQLTRAAAGGAGPVVYVVHHDDLLGRRGPGSAMVACGLLSGARTAAIAGIQAGIPVNVLAVETGSEPEAVARWAVRLLERDGPTGELVRLGGSHLGKALP